MELHNISSRPESFFRMIPQDGVRHSVITDHPEHNAIWDMNVRASDGRVFFSVCGEGLNPQYARLFEYIPGEGRFVNHFAVEKESIQHDRTIRASKFHTAIQFLDDGRLIMQTHTTSPSPRHPSWLPESYVNHQHEAFRGSELFFYDPDTGRAEYKGVLAPYSTLYGGGLSNRGRVYFGAGTFDGVGWLYDIDANEAVCLGQVTDGRSNRFTEGPDGHIYYGTATGHLARLNADTRKIEIVMLTRERSPLRHGVFDGDGVFWFSARKGKSLYTYDTVTGEGKEIGRFFEDDELSPGNIFCYGLAMDGAGCIWFCANVNAGTEGTLEGRSSGSRLFKWDARNGKKAVDFGFIGTPGTRAIALCAQASIHDDILFVTDGNHLDDQVGIVEIDLRKMTEDKIDDSRPLATDPIVYMPFENSVKYFPLGGAEYDKRVEKHAEFWERARRDRIFQSENSSFAKFAGETGIALWESVGYGNGAVRALKWEDAETISGVCGTDELYAFRLKLGADGFYMDEFNRDDGAEIPSRLTADIPEGLILPCVPGRRYLAEAECGVYMRDGSIVGGTGDMMLFRITGGRVISLGAVTTSGGVHCLSATPDGAAVYGVAGHECGRGDIFKYDESDGLVWLGGVPITTTPTGRQLVTKRPWVCAVSPDGKRLAIGALDEMSGVSVYTL